MNIPPPKQAMLAEMLLLAVQKHHGTFDKGGKLYIMHPLRVMHRLRTTDVELQCIALGHDLVEDCGVTYLDLRLIGMSERVIDGIRRLTKIPGQTYEEYQKLVLESYDCCRVKREDVRDNLDVRRLKGLSEKDIARVVKYQQFYVLLEEAIANFERQLTTPQSA